eukprot:XP_001709913.1 Hypothetical protein GL50803_17603 [Giardia lamblia ATCC 50803]
MVTCAEKAFWNFFTAPNIYSVICATVYIIVPNRTKKIGPKYDNRDSRPLINKKMDDKSWLRPTASTASSFLIFKMEVSDRTEVALNVLTAPITRIRGTITMKRAKGASLIDLNEDRNSSLQRRQVHLRVRLLGS